MKLEIIKIKKIFEAFKCHEYSTFNKLLKNMIANN